jgi:hypothetical protein
MRETFFSTNTRFSRDRVQDRDGERLETLRFRTRTMNPSVVTSGARDDDDGGLESTSMSQTA